MTPQPEPMPLKQLAEAKASYADGNRAPWVMNALAAAFMARPTPQHAQDEREVITQAAVQISKAWIRYSEFFGEVPHGTERQIAAMLELCRDKSFLRRRDSNTPQPEQDYEKEVEEALSWFTPITGAPFCTRGHERPTKECDDCMGLVLAAEVRRTRDSKRTESEGVGEGVSDEPKSCEACRESVDQCGQPNMVPSCCWDDSSTYKPCPQCAPLRGPEGRESL